MRNFVSGVILRDFNHYSQYELEMFKRNAVSRGKTSPTEKEISMEKKILQINESTAPSTRQEYKETVDIHTSEFTPLMNSPEFLAPSGGAKESVPNCVSLKDDSLKRIEFHMKEKFSEIHPNKEIKENKRKSQEKKDQQKVKEANEPRSQSLLKRMQKEIREHGKKFVLKEFKRKIKMAG